MSLQFLCSAKQVNEKSEELRVIVVILLTYNKICIVDIWFEALGAIAEAFCAVMEASHLISYMSQI